MQTALTKRLRIAHPIFQAPMAGGATTIDLVSAVSQAGALGFLGCAYSAPDAIREAATAVRARTAAAFGINLFAPQPAVGVSGDLGRVMEILAPVHEELGIPPPLPPAPTDLAFSDQLRAALETEAEVFSFTFGLLPPEALATLRDRGRFVIGTATTVDEAIALERAGVDAIVAQGSEAGAHRGTFGPSFEAAMIGTLALVPQVVDAVDLPVIASGGIMDGRGVAAALVLGAEATQLGTAFLTCPEAGISAAHKRAILGGREDQTRITRAFSGRPARGLVNRLMDDFDREPDAILPFPIQNAWTRPARNAAAAQDRHEYLSLWAGQGARLARQLPAEELVKQIMNETSNALRRLGSS